ncbi:MAG: tetratricopeptide repeat protein [Hyphomicrobiales bacterium]
MMQRLCLLLLVLVLGGFSSATVQDRAADEPAGIAEAGEPGDLGDLPLDELFGKLAAARDEAEAQGVEVVIRARWLQAGGDTIALLMSRVMDAIFTQDYGLALDLLDAVTQLDPDYAEAWSQRATIHYLEDDFGKALAELERALALDPRHFGALADMGLVLKAIGEDARAFAFLERALALNPYLKEARKARDELAPDILGRDI